MNAEVAALGNRLQTPAFKPCIVIPHYNHPRSVATVLSGLKPCGVDCYLVDDASDAANQPLLDEIVSRERDWVRLFRLPHNRGKGAAVMLGCDAAYEAGYTHALQIDADGQHCTADAPRLIAAAQQRPHALICGVPIYDDSVPRSRLYGRYVTHVWVWINTLSFQVKDSMCGLRVYPLAESTALWKSTPIGERMEFDVEVLVRLVWRGTGVINMPTPVTYPLDGVSHFRVWRDNFRISGMHARLFFGMLWRSPMLIARRVARRLSGSGREAAA